MNKKGSNFMMNWPEYFTVMMIIIGFMIVLLATNQFMIYVLISLLSIILGKFLKQKSGKFSIPFWLIVAGFFIGFILAILITKRADWRIATLLSLFMVMASHKFFSLGYFNE